MTNTEASPIAPARWVSASRTPSAYRAVTELFRLDAPADEVAELFTALIRIRGAHKVEIARRPGEWSHELGAFEDSPWFGILFRGTDRAQATARRHLEDSGLINEDRNADHDHAACVARAAAMGVPAAWAHAPETYLST